MMSTSMEAYWRTENALLLNTSVLDGLRSLPEGSVHCVVTSPPYLGLRNYGTEPVAWGGEPKCIHSWHEGTHYRYSPVRTGAEGIGYRDADATRKQHTITDSRCVWCGAWRGQLGLESLHDCLAWARSEPPCPLCYVCHMRTIFRELSRVLRNDGTVWLNIADSYNGSGGAGGDYRPGGLREGQSGYPGRHFAHLKPKNLTGIPWRCALALQADGWTLRSDIIWHKPNGMPQSVTDRPSSSHEHLLLFAQSRRYFYDADAIREPHKSVSIERAQRGRNPGHKWEAGPGGQTITTDMSRALHPSGRNRRDVWTIPTKPYRRAHFATFPPALVEPCVLAGTSEHGCCPGCGAPWKRVVERGKPLSDWQRMSGAGRDGQYGGHDQKDYGDQTIQRAGAVKRRILEGMRERLTTGWKPTCDCEAESVQPCVVLDPFAGSGTTGAVALQHGRMFLGIELNPSYCDLAVERIRATYPKA